MRFATQGYNRDVVFGVLLGQQCDALTAGQIADSAIALHASRQAELARDAEVEEKKEEPLASERSGLKLPLLRTGIIWARCGFSSSTA